MSRHTRSEKIEAIGRVIDTLDILREKCPWDHKQTNESLRPNTIEEVHELAEALIEGSPIEIKKELGDVLLHILFYSKIGDEKNQFDIADVAAALNQKLIYRHPHVFGDVTISGSHDVELNWEQLKLKEKGGNKTVLAGVPRSLPALIKAYRIQEKAANVGFDWDNTADVVDKVREEIAEFEAERTADNKEAMEEEFGDILFSLANLGRHLGINPENALEKSNQKFIRRFNKVEAETLREGRDMKSMTLQELDALWNKAKRDEI